jgi:hypothetical protein
VQGLTNLLAILYQGHGFQFNLLKNPLLFVQPGHLTVQTGAPGHYQWKAPLADEVLAHLVGLVGSTVKVTLEIEAEILSSAPDNLMCTVTANSRTLKCTSQSFEVESR